MANSKGSTTKTDRPTSGDLLSRSQRLRLADVERATNCPMERFVRDAVNNWLFDVAPVYMYKARGRQLSS